MRETGSNAPQAKHLVLRLAGQVELVAGVDTAKCDRGDEMREANEEKMHVEVR